jgi:hypothetical protein
MRGCCSSEWSRLPGTRHSHTDTRAHPSDEKVVRAPYSSQNGESEVGVKGLVKL